MKQFTEAELRKLLEEAFDEGVSQADLCSTFLKEGEEARQEYIDSVMEKL